MKWERNKIFTEIKRGKKFKIQFQAKPNRFVAAVLVYGRCSRTELFGRWVVSRVVSFFILTDYVAFLFPCYFLHILSVILLSPSCSQAFSNMWSLIEDFFLCFVYLCFFLFFSQHRHFTLTLRLPEHLAATYRLALFCLLLARSV